MKRVIGIGGIFFKSKDPKALRAWYHQHLGINSEEWGAQFSVQDLKPDSYQVWNPFKADTTYFEPSHQAFMLNLIVDDLEKLLEELKKEGIQLLEEMQVNEFGKFGWCLDPEGNKIELWEPPRS